MILGKTSLVNGIPAGFLPDGTITQLFLVLLSDVINAFLIFFLIPNKVVRHLVEFYFKASFISAAIFGQINNVHVFEVFSYLSISC